MGQSLKTNRFSMPLEGKTGSSSSSHAVSTSPRSARPSAATAKGEASIRASLPSDDMQADTPSNRSIKSLSYADAVPTRTGRFSTPLEDSAGTASVGSASPFRRFGGRPDSITRDDTSPRSIRRTIDREMSIVDQVTFEANPLLFSKRRASVSVDN